MSYIVFEGGEGSGKSTQAKIFAERLGADLTREPGGTQLGGHIRSLLLSSDIGQVDPSAEVLLMAADRAQHLREIVRPALAAGKHIVSDRSIYSSLAYQGVGRNVGSDTVRQVNELALQGCWPDIVVLLDVTLEESKARLASRTLDRFEQAGDNFHRNVLHAYREFALEDSVRWVRIDGSASVGVVSEKVWAAVSDRFVLEGA